MDTTLNSHIPNVVGPLVYITTYKQELIRRWDSERELLVRRYLTRTSKYSPLLNIQHDAGCMQTRQWRREWAWPRGITVTTAPRFSHAPIYCNEVRFEVILPEYHLTAGEFLSLTPSLGVITANIAISNISLKTRNFGLYFCRRKFRHIFNHFYSVHAESYWSRWNNAKNGHYAVQGHSRSPIWYQLKAHVVIPTSD